MNVAVAAYDAKQDAIAPASEAGPAPKRIVVAFGFWVFLLSDIVMFSALFAAYAVLARATAGGPTGAELFNQVNVAIQTAFLLISSYTCFSEVASDHFSRQRTVVHAYCFRLRDELSISDSRFFPLISKAFPRSAHVITP